MYFADEIRDPVEATGYEPSGRAPKPREVTIARQLIESMTTDWDPERYRDTYRERVEELIESKRNGEEIEAAAPAPRASKVVDLTEMLRQSVEQARGRGQKSQKSQNGQPGRKGAKQDTGPAEEDLSAMSKTQLAQLAAELEIPGRSKMTRDELEQAVRDARRPRPKAVS
jgi:DNA end-binding protein Ku